MKKSLTLIALITIIILLIPLVAMQFTDGVNWNITDFIVMGILLFATGLALMFAVRNPAKPAHRIIAYIVIVIVFLLIWAELAVGIFGTPWAGS